MASFNSTDRKPHWTVGIATTYFGKCTTHEVNTVQKDSATSAARRWHQRKKTGLLMVARIKRDMPNIVLNLASCSDKPQDGRQTTDVFLDDEPTDGPQSATSKLRGFPEEWLSFYKEHSAITFSTWNWRVRFSFSICAGSVIVLGVGFCASASTGVSIKYGVGIIGIIVSGMLRYVMVVKHVHCT